MPFCVKIYLVGIGVCKEMLILVLFSHFSYIMYTFGVLPYSARWLLKDALL